MSYFMRQSWSLAGSRAGLTAERKKQLTSLVRVLSTYPQYANACSYYSYLLDMELHGATEPLPFLQAMHRRLVQDRPQVREPIPGLEGKKLRVVFARG